MSVSVKCHPTAVVDPGAELADGVTVGPYAIVRDKVEIGAGTEVGPHAVIDSYTRLGRDCTVFPHACVGTIPQDLKFKGEVSWLEAADRNTFREFVTVNRGTEGGGGITRIGSDNLFMAYTHIAHDCQIGDHVILGNGATLGGHVVIEDWAIASAFCGVQQFCRIGQHAFLAGYSGVTKDVVPFSRVHGNHASVYGLNTVGLRRRGFASEVRAELKRAFRILFRQNHNISQALEIIADEDFRSEEVATLVDFIRRSERGVVR